MTLKIHFQKYAATYMLRNMKTHQKKMSQSCWDYSAIETGNLVASLRMIRKRQMQHRNEINNATSATQAPRTSRTFNINQCLQ
jgi:hypothetical protein